MTHEYPDSTKVVLPDTYLIELGKISVQWSIFESILNLALIKLAGKDYQDPASHIIFAHMTFPLKFDVLSSLVHERRARYPHLAAFDDVSKIIKKAQEGRNKVVHAVWHLDEETGKVRIPKLTARGKLKTSIEDVSIRDLQHITNDIGTASASLLKMILSR